MGACPGPCDKVFVSLKYRVMGTLTIPCGDVVVRDLGRRGCSESSLQAVPCLIEFLPQLVHSVLEVLLFSFPHFYRSPPQPFMQAPDK